MKFCTQPLLPLVAEWVVLPSLQRKKNRHIPRLILTMYIIITMVNQGTVVAMNPMMVIVKGSMQSQRENDENKSVNGFFFMVWSLAICNIWWVFTLDDMYS
ncbi:hypothetical protein CMV_008484 [Castanea mollissima]|uniref:Uncharacterized protein n=1 Tax=Castanea mollissima TaxID=60419 RepID=A0A8J4RJP6_9ROSI|nr:hypothetical protein CMV_008484 [Castanea mollissima]